MIIQMTWRLRARNLTSICHVSMILWWICILGFEGKEWGGSTDLFFAHRSAVSVYDSKARHIRFSINTFTKQPIHPSSRQSTKVTFQLSTYPLSNRSTIRSGSQVYVAPRAAGTVPTRMESLRRMYGRQDLRYTMMPRLA